MGFMFARVIDPAFLLHTPEGRSLIYRDIGAPVSTLGLVLPHIPHPNIRGHAPRLNICADIFRVQIGTGAMLALLRFSTREAYGIARGVVLTKYSYPSHHCYVCTPAVVARSFAIGSSLSQMVVRERYPTDNSGI